MIVNLFGSGEAKFRARSGVHSMGVSGRMLPRKILKFSTSETVRNVSFFKNHFQITFNQEKEQGGAHKNSPFIAIVSL